MKHQGGCHCQQFSFETDIDPMLIVQCNCKSCRRITGSINIGCLYGETEVKFMGETNVYEFAGGSGFINKAPSFTISGRDDILEQIKGVPEAIFSKTICPNVSHEEQKTAKSEEK